MQVILVVGGRVEVHDEIDVVRETTAVQKYDFDNVVTGEDILAFLPATDVVMHAAYPYPAGPGTPMS